MKNIFTYVVLLVAVIACKEAPKQEAAGGPECVRLNQLGYLPSGPKVFAVADHATTSFSVVNTDGEQVFAGKLTSRGTWDKSGEQIATGDFSDLKTPGTYKIQLDDGTTSYPFRIGSEVFDSLKIASLKAYYLHRVSLPLEEKYAGIYHRPAGHADMALPFHPSTGHTEGTLDTPGGWYDAGDYGKYIVNAGISVGMMLSAYEQYPQTYPDGSVNLPESGNEIPDLLDELKYEIDWMLTMQDTDGGVFVKVTSLGFGPFVMPDKAPRDRYVIGKSTAAALNLSAVCAMAARIYRPFDADYAAKCQAAAISAWQWAVKHPDVYYAKNPEGVQTGAYNDTVLDEEFFWAAAELYVTTGEPEYLQNIQLLLGNITFRVSENWRNYDDNLGYYSLLGPASPLADGQKKQVSDGLLRLADSLANQQAKNPYRIPLEEFVWGSNSDILDAAMIYANAYRVSNEKKYRALAIETFDYLLGKNATGYSFVTGYGSKSPMHIHHRPSESDGIEAPYPGFVAGGPNGAMQDKNDLARNNLQYASTLPARAYIDAQPSFASNEICINWNAPCVYMLAFLDANKE